MQAEAVTAYFQDANSAFIGALKRHFAPQKATGKTFTAKGSLSTQLRHLLHTDAIGKILNNDFSDMPANMHETPWHQPAVKVWMDIIDLFEDKGKSGDNSFYATMRTAAASLNLRRRTLKIFQR